MANWFVSHQLGFFLGGRNFQFQSICNTDLFAHFNTVSSISTAVLNTSTLKESIYFISCLVLCILKGLNMFGESLSPFYSKDSLFFSYPYSTHLVSACDMDLHNFPIDVQNCSLIFGSCKYIKLLTSARELMLSACEG